MNIVRLDLFRLKYEDKWLHTYELAKASLNNRANEIRSIERRSNESKENPVVASTGEATDSNENMPWEDAENN